MITLYSNVQYPNTVYTEATSLDQKDLLFHKTYFFRYRFPVRNQGQIIYVRKVEKTV
jgi:hypothetical protein